MQSAGRVLRHPISWLTLIGGIWGWFGTPLWIPIRGRFVWSSPYSFYVLSILLGLTIGFLIGVLVCVLWLPKKLGVRDGLRTGMGWGSVIVCVICLMTQFHLGEVQYMNQYNLGMGLNLGLEPILEAWRQTDPKQPKEDEQTVGMQLTTGGTALSVVSSPLYYEDGVNHVLTLSNYMTEMGLDMQSGKMSDTERKEFNQFLQTAGPYIDKHVAQGGDLSPRDLQAVFNVLYDSIPSEYQNM